MKKKILHVIPSLEKGGAQRLVVSICNELQKSGYETKIIVFCNNNQFKSETKDLKVEVINLTYKTSFFQQFYSDNINILDKAIRDFSPQIIHSHLFQADLLVRINLFEKAKYFSHLHDHSYLLNIFKIRSLTIKNLIKLHDLIFLNNLFKRSKNTFFSISSEIDNFYKKKINRLGLTMFKVYNCFDQERFKGIQRERKNEINLINCARCVPIKNQKFLIEVMNTIINDYNYSNIKLTILGDGILFNELKEQIKIFNLENYINLTKMVNDVENYYENAYIYLHSGLDGVFGISTLEAIASGLPIVALKGNSEDEFIINKQNCLLIENNNIEKYKDGILELIENQSLYSEISNNNLNLSQNFSSTNYVNKLIKIYFN